MVAACSKDKELKHVWDGKPVLSYGKTKPKARTSAKTNFAQFPLPEGPAKLSVPVDWKQNPHKSKTWRARLHRWEWIWPLLQAYQSSKDKASLKDATLLALNWVEQNPLQGNDTALGWGSDNAAWRAQALGYLVRTATDAGLLTGEQQDRLLTSVREHAAWLANDEHHDNTRHTALYLDFGLAVMCANLNKLPDCKAWSGIARERFLETANRFFDRKSGIHKQHTPWQHFVQAELVHRMAAVGKDAGIQELDKRIAASSLWLVPPDGYNLMVGEANRSKVSKNNVTAAKAVNGVKLLGDSGYAVAKHDDTYLFASASFFSNVRKHADELGFSWFAKGQPVLTDSGRAHSSKPALLKYSQSAMAHNTLTVNGGDFALLGKPYGSGMLASGSGADWQAVLGTNPTLARVQTQHQRLWLQRPGRLLLVVDRVQSPKSNRYDRYFHFFPDLKVELSDTGVGTTKVKDTALSVFDVSGDDKVEAKLLRNVEKPVQGVMFPSERKSVANDVLQLSTEGSDVVLATLFELGESKLKPADVAVDVQDGVFFVVLGDEKLGITQNKDQLKIELGREKGKASKSDAGADALAKDAATKKPGAAPAPASKAPGAPAKVAAPPNPPAAPKPAAPVKAP